MFIELRIPWILFTAIGVLPQPCYVPPGTYELERIASPVGEPDRPWLVIRGTRVGASEEFLSTMDNSGYGEFQITRNQSGPRLSLTLEKNAPIIGQYS